MDNFVDTIFRSLENLVASAADEKYGTLAERFAGLRADDAPGMIAGEDLDSDEADWVVSEDEGDANTPRMTL